MSQKWAVAYAKVTALDSVASDDAEEIQRNIHDGGEACKRRMNRFGEF